MKDYEDATQNATALKAEGFNIMIYYEDGG